MDDDLIRSLSTSVFELVNKEREKLGLPMLIQREGSSRWTWNDICSKVRTPLYLLLEFLFCDLPPHF